MWAVGGDLPGWKSAVQSKLVGFQSHLVMHAWFCLQPGKPGLDGHIILELSNLRLRGSSCLLKTQKLNSHKQ